MTFDNLTSISPIDGRYSDKTSPLKAIFSEFGLIKYRLLVEVRWLEAMSNNPNISEVILWICALFFGLNMWRRFYF